MIDTNGHIEHVSDDGDLRFNFTVAQLLTSIRGPDSLLSGTAQ